MSIILNQPTEVEMEPLCDNEKDEIIEKEKAEITEDTKKEEKEETNSVQNTDIVEEPITTTGIQISFGKYYDININLEIFDNLVLSYSIFLIINFRCSTS